jgi:uncharacterized protein
VRPAGKFGGTPSPRAGEGGGEGGTTSRSLEPPHPNPLPAGEREHAEQATPHLPYTAAIESYGKGGFSFAGMSHRGSLLCLPNGIWAWPVVRASDINEAMLAPVFDAADEIGLFLIGSGREPWVMPDALRLRFHERKLNVEVTRTGTAVSTYNILLGEGRRIAAGLIAVE